ncbi:hypothetical protein [Sphingorhabdus sp. YGSMI21]|uniref:hypothetical protein n=1 Tax=Sphingorhabdus sp. YGSMI21 TaxID=2077182 RepID=UPI000C1E9C7F|nr:hypothetical protein [Sphingorhabdus sp. YGSMI21]ATW02941.1 hypothetical protein CHN51_04870 [Sphingorhabdus sp. YGSMI21]
MNENDAVRLSPFIAKKLADPKCLASERKTLEHELDWIDAGFIDPPEKAAITYLDAFRKFQFELVPSSGLVSLAFDISVIIGRLYGQLPNRYFTPSNIAKRGEALSERFSAARSDLMLFLNQSGQFLDFSENGQAREKFNFGRDEFSTLESISRKLDLMSSEIRLKKLPKKWAASDLRHVRIRLAGELSEVFLREFGKEPKPLGGSSSLSLDDENDWVRFYQAVAFLLMDESATPDRQAILWSGYKIFKLAKSRD